VETYATQVAASIEKQIQLVAQSSSMANALQMKLYLSYVTVQSTTDIDLELATYASYKEYKFVSGCTVPACPADFGDISKTTRLPDFNGSINSSSVYLYNSVVRRNKYRDLTTHHAIVDRKCS
jgi:hypothetical protein